MAYRVEVTARASRDLRRIYRTINADYSGQAAAWFNGLEALVLSLEKHPSRGSSVPENVNLRQLFYGSKPNIYRVIYGIDETAGVVRILHIRHGAPGLLCRRPSVEFSVLDVHKFVAQDRETLDRQPRMPRSVTRPIAARPPCLCTSGLLVKPPYVRARRIGPHTGQP